MHAGHDRDAGGEVTEHGAELLGIEHRRVGLIGHAGDITRVTPIAPGDSGIHIDGVDPHRVDRHHRALVARQIDQARIDTVLGRMYSSEKT